MSAETDHGARILVVTDPGLPLLRFKAVQERFEARLEERFGEPVLVHVQDTLIETRPDGSLRLGAAASYREDFESIGGVLVLTEMPRYSAGRLLVAEAYPDDDVAVVFWPTLGILARRRKVADILTNCALQLITGTALPGEASRTVGRRSQWTPGAANGALELRARPVTGAVQTVISMVMTNAPWRTVRELSGALAAASAAGAFGIFYSSIWQMSADLPTARLLAMGLLAIATMTGWLIISNGLWDGPVHGAKTGPTFIYNLSTAATLFVCVLALYAALVVLILLGSLVVITPRFMSVIIQEPADFSNYLSIAWLSAEMGVVAGGLGATFDSSTDLRQLTHASRERTREREDEDKEPSDDEQRTDDRSG